MAKYDGWIFKSKRGLLIIWTFCRTKREARRRVSDWGAWQKLGFKLVKVKFMEVK